LATERHAEEDWRQCWRVRHDPFPGLKAALPIGASIRATAAGGMPAFLDKCFASGRQHCMVHWVAWAPDKGLLQASSHWVSGGGEPDVPLERWFDVSSPKRLFNPGVEGTSVLLKGFCFKAGSLLMPEWPDLQFIGLGALPFPVQAGEALTRLRAQELAAETVSQFLDALPEGMRECMRLLGRRGRDSGQLTSSATGISPVPAWLLGNGYAAGLPVEECGRRRRQLVLAYPALAYFSTLSRMTRGIDAGKQAVAMLADVHSVPQALVRSLAGLEVDLLSPGDEPSENLPVLDLLAKMPPSWWSALPSMDHAAWEGMKALACHAHCKLDGTTVAASLRPEGGSLAWLAGTADAWAHLYDMATDMEAELVTPAAVHLKLERRAAHYRDCLRQALLHLGARRLARTLDVHLGDAIRGVGQDVTDDRWGQAAPDVVAPSGLTMRFLGNQAELTREGEVMGHCVGTYGPGCARRTCAIMSVGSWRHQASSMPVWSPLSTAEFCLRQEGEGHSRLCVIQHQGVGNSRPPRVCVQALEWWLGEQASGRIALLPGSLVPMTPAGYGAVMDPTAMRRRLGADWHTPAAHVRRWERWRRLMDVRSPSFSHWLLSLPGFLEDRRCEMLAEVASDMDEDMARLGVRLHERYGSEPGQPGSRL
jgi:hypothetical protein